MKRLGQVILDYFLPFFLGGGAGALLYLAGGSYPLYGLTWTLTITVIALLLLLLLYDLFAAFRLGGGEGSFVPRELRLLFVTTSLVMMGADFASSSGIMFYPLIFLLVLYAGTFSNPYSLVGVGLYAMALRWVKGGGAQTYPEVVSALTFSIFVVLFAVFGVFFLRAEVARLRASGRQAMEQYFQNLVETARAFRFIAMPSSGLQSIKEDRKVKILSIQSALEETRTTIFALLETLREGFNLHSCVALWLGSDGSSLRVIEASTISEHLRRGEIPAQYGVTGAAIRHGRTLSFCPVDLRTKIIPYYEAVEEVRSICIVPVMEDREVRGVLCADRLVEDPFTQEEQKILELVSGQIMKVVRTERTILTMARSRHEQGKLYRAASRLKDAVREEQVVEVLFDSAREIMKWDMAALTTYDRARRRHCIAFADGKGAESIRGFVFSDNEGLVSQAVKLGHSLPWKGDYDPQTQIIFTRKLKFRDLRSLFVIPVVAGEKALGAVVLAAEREGAFGSEKCRLLQVIVDQSAVAYQNACNIRQLEKTAATDALTGLFNRRVFMEALGRKFQSAQRFGRDLSIIMTDLDRFKSINDAHGHHVGDEVLKMFADVLRDSARQVDLVARWGGEEFIILCEETDREGARSVAERIRADLESRVLQLEDGTAVQVTCSLGVAAFPGDASAMQALIERADEYLYAAKKAGRNRVASAAGEGMKEAV
jgi:two-component system cell cycle response regulator